MNKLSYLILILICLACGSVFFLIQRKWLVVYWTLAPIQSNVRFVSKDNSTQKNISLFFWKNEKLRHNDAIIIWNTENKHSTLKQLIDAWLSVLYEEKVFTKKISTESIALSKSEQEAYISLNQCPPWQEWSIQDKWSTVESLLKTIRDTELDIKFISILVNGKPLEDPHLSFNQLWPIEGFKENT
jgi:hypothetical protein